MVKVTGIAIHFAIQDQKKKAKILTKKFENNIKRFKTDPQDSLIEISEAIEKNELIVARLQSLLTRYNMSVSFEWEGEKIALADGIRITGVSERTETRWRKTVEDSSGGGYGSGSGSREQNTEYREHSLAFDERAKQQEKAQQVAARIRKAIQIANAQTIELSINDELVELL